MKLYVNIFPVLVNEVEEFDGITFTMKNARPIKIDEGTVFKFSHADGGYVNLTAKGGKYLAYISPEIFKHCFNESEVDV